ncbi:hypothetical protein BDV96DRAFT_688501 [Lophiotrema nucula]|uniref:Zn(2)-C6 fungal-type domain-containing protein n=1 Tax=Lophiotrema nucula TaxID=690887 RepID=A0A6A5Z509_9PLEO|nr:hypothetical protein BDV96DRAFT_688501 [Lophiotrema nucula]
MVFYGAVSKGCQRCRQRKIKCDQQKPGCIRCKKAKTDCPGYRDLSNVIFRDESKRIIRKARKAQNTVPVKEILSPAFVDSITVWDLTSPSTSSTPLPSSISPSLCQSLNEIAAHFFFARYTCDQPPLSRGYQAWLLETYCNAPLNHALRTAIEATGMAGISNVCYAPEIAAQSKALYGRALAATNRSLEDPLEMAADETLITVIFLALFEFITLEDWSNYSSWATHIEGATTLLQLRGQKQFDYERGGMLLMQLRHQILFACMQRNIRAPPALLPVIQSFKLSVLGTRRQAAQPPPMADLCFQLVEIQAAVKKGTITDLDTIRRAAFHLDKKLLSWRATLSKEWEYQIVTVDGDVAVAVGDGDGRSCKYFEGKKHIYASPWRAHIWNNWRALRILANQIILRTAESPLLDDALLELIHRLSSEICVSAPEFIGTPRSAGLIWPLSVVAQGSWNKRSVRCWAVEQLRLIGTTVGVRQATLLAESILKDINSVDLNIGLATLEGFTNPGLDWSDV